MKISVQWPYKLNLVTDEKSCLGRDFFWVVEEAIKGGVDIVQLREKELSDDGFLEKALRLKELTVRYDVPLIINDNLKIAMACDADGIHVGNSDISPLFIRKEWSPLKIIGYSIEHTEQMVSPEAAASSYLAASPIFGTPTKTDTIIEWGLHGLRQLRKLSSQPLFAIGGIDEHNAFRVSSAGADCIAVVSAICGADAPAYAAEKIRNEIERGRS